MRQSAALSRWDSIRTAIFGEPSSEGFQEHFDSFLKGDETTELRKRLKEIENKGSPGLRILRALMELREKRDREEAAGKVKDSKDRSGWSLVKHLMLLNLPSAVHPMWQFVSENVLDKADSRRTSFSSVSENQLFNAEEDPRHEARKRARQRWRLVKKLFLSDDYQRTKQIQHPLWKQLREFFFAYDDEAVISEASPAPPPPDQPTTSVQRPDSKWDTVKRLLLSKVVIRNYDFLSKYAKNSLLDEEGTNKHTSSNKGPLSRIPRLPVVDEEPPSKEKWRVVRELLLEETLGTEWRQLSEKASVNVDPPIGTEWEVFRWLFFEDRRLRNETQWILIKDLLLKSDDDS